MQEKQCLLSLWVDVDIVYKDSVLTLSSFTVMCETYGGRYQLAYSRRD